MFSLHLLYRTGMDEAFSCATFDVAMAKQFPKSAVVSYQDRDGSLLTGCKEVEERLSQMTCASDWVRTVWEQHVLNTASN